MQHFFTQSDHFAETTVTLTGDEHHHATRACRVRTGEMITVTDGLGKRVIARIADIDAAKLVAMIEQDVSGRGELPAAVTLALSAINPARFETAVEKCTELGIRRILLVEAERCEKNAVRRLKQDRIKRIALSSAKQSGRSWVPVISEPVKLDEIIRDVNGSLLVASQHAAQTVGGALTETENSGDITILVGPEGDFSETEYAALDGIALPVYLGGLTLRSETAAITAVALTVNYFNEQMIANDDQGER